MKPSARLLRWYKIHGRDLPWRHTRNPYKILVSEIMLQQTQVERVKIFYKHWLKKYPNWKALAKASNASVIKSWAGLGYNRRALALRDIAKQVVAQGIPKTKDVWQELKGIGPYTAAALSAFAQKQRAMPIDTNIRRVLGRFLFGIPYPQISDDKRILSQVDTFLQQRGAHYDVPQAIFDLATSICTKIPDCASCPLKTQCKASKKFLSGRVKTPKQMIQKSNEKKHRNKKHPDRIYRGRILKLVREQQPILIKRIGVLIDESYDDVLDRGWVSDMIDRLKKDGMIKQIKQRLSL